MDRNPMSYSRNCTRYHAPSAGLSTVHRELVKVSQAVIGTRIRRERISFHHDRHVTNSLYRVTPDLVRDCQQKITRPTGAPGWVTVEEMIDSRTVCDHKIGSNRCRHFKTFQRVVPLDPLTLPPTKNHGIEVKLSRKISERLFRKTTYLSLIQCSMNKCEAICSIITESHYPSLLRALQAYSKQVKLFLSITKYFSSHDTQLSSIGNLPI